MADSTVTQSVLVPEMREVHIPHFPAGNKDNFSAFIFIIGTAPGNSDIKQDATEHQHENQFSLHRIPPPQYFNFINIVSNI